MKKIKLTISDLDGFAEICDSNVLLSEVGGECSLSDMATTLTDEQKKQQEEELKKFMDSHGPNNQNK